MENDCPKSYFWAGDRSREIDDDFYRSLKKVSPEFSSMIKRAVDCVNRHGLGVILTLKDPENLSSVTTAFISKIDDKLPVDEALILAVEMYDIFHNNPHVYQLKLELGYGRRVFIATAAAGEEADIAVIVLNKKGEYLTSYDHIRKEFFPTKLKVSEKHKQILEACLVDMLSKLYGVVRENISKEREKIDKESESAASSETR